MKKGRKVFFKLLIKILKFNIYQLKKNKRTKKEQRKGEHKCYKQVNKKEKERNIRENHQIWLKMVVMIRKQMNC